MNRVKKSITPRKFGVFIGIRLIVKRLQKEKRLLMDVWYSEFNYDIICISDDFSSIEKLGTGFKINHFVNFDQMVGIIDKQFSTLLSSFNKRRRKTR